ncbi:MAG: AAA family ATPase, partial [bacterium]
MASQETPVVFFLDDLQWADPPSVQLIEALALDPALDHLLLVASYRANEVGLGHPLQSMLERLREASPNVVEIKLEPLSKDAVQQMLANTLRAETKDLRV